MCLGLVNYINFKNQFNKMNKIVIAETYLVNTKTILKNNTDFSSVDEIEIYLKGEIEKDKIATYIETFDHYAHTKSIGGSVPADILASKNVLCCFGMAIPSPEFMAVKPMSIAIVEKPESFVLSFIEAPAPSVQQTMISWIDGIENA